jgi:prepilin-type N-terminal cleavage/methylation domain-containing protein
MIAARRPDARGFTLLEMLAALAIMGMVIAVAAPALVRTIETAAFASQSDRIAREIEGLRAKALLERRRFVFPGTGAAPLEELSAPLPDGWTIEGEPVVFLDTGVCLGGALTISDGKGRSRVLTLEAPDCRLAPDRRTQARSADRTARQTTAGEASHL